ncbi:MAG: hypothetical protein JXB03_02745 [Spirochaetales bacterium]|nr:hypothetical protein [Spirochaetales bacterium]
MDTQSHALPDAITVKDSLERAVSATFAEMAFIDVNPVDPQPVDSRQITSIDIASPFRGRIIVRLPLEVKKNIVEYVHGVGWDTLNPDQIDDCLLELLNVVGGTFLFNLYGEGMSYKVLFPEMIFDESELTGGAPDVEIYFDAEGTVFSVSFTYEK